MSRVLIVIAMLVASSLSLAETSQKMLDELKSKVEKAIPGLKVTSVADSVVDGIYEVDSNNDQMIYVSADGKSFLVGDIYQVERNGLVNVSEKKREEKRAAILASIDKKDFISFAPKETKKRIMVFTDIDCGYCRKLHQEIPRLNELGIQVDYLAYPRAGVGSKSYDKAVSAWCGDDPRARLTDAKNGKAIPDKVCANPVAAQHELGQRLGVTGTPAIMLENGEIIRGYMPADALAKGLGVL